MTTYEEEEQSASNILPAFFRYKFHLMIAIPVLVMLAVTVVMLIPPIYRSTGVIMVETQQIPTELVQSTVTGAAAQQIKVIGQRVMTREKMLNITKSYDYFGLKDADPLKENAILEAFKNNVEIEVTSARSGRRAVAIGFNVSFNSDSPSIAKAVATDLTRLFLEENVKARTERAEETTQFLQSEAEKMKVELERIEAEVAEFKRANKDALPEHLDLYVNMREDIRKSLSSIEEAISSTDYQIRLLQNQMSLSQAQSGGEGPIDSELLRMKEEYRKLSLKYQPEHPDLVELRQSIEALESGGGSQTDAIIGDSSVNLSLRSQIAELTSKREKLEQEKQTAIAKLEDTEARIIKIPQIERGFTAINRNYQTVLRQYQSLQAKAQSAAMAESLEEEQKAERFRLLEAPLLPIRPHKPERLKLLGAAVVFSIGFPIGIVLVIGFLDKSVRSSESLERIIGAPTLVDIPEISTQEELDHRRKMLILVFGGGILFAAIAVAGVHFLYMPLDVLINKFMLRLGS